jgi:hypothetical protein
MGGFNVTDNDQRGGTFVDHLNLSTRFIRGDHGDLESLLKSPYHWRGSHRHEGTVGMGDFLNHEGNTTYHKDATLAPDVMTEGKAHSIDFHMPVVVMTKAMVPTVIAGLATHGNPVYNYGDWDTADVKDSVAVTGDGIKYGVKDVSDVSKITAGRHYMYIDVSGSGVVLPSDAKLATHRFYRPFIVINNPADWELKLAGFVEDTPFYDTNGYHWNFTPGSIVHEYQEFLPSMFTFDLVRKNRPTHDEPYTRITLPPGALTVEVDETTTDKQAIYIKHNMIDKYSASDSTSLVSHSISLRHNHVTYLTHATEPITDIWAEILTPPNHDVGTTAGQTWSEEYKHDHIRVFARTKSGYNFLLNKKMYTVTIPNVVGPYSHGCMVTVKVVLNNSPLERHFRVNVRPDKVKAGGIIQGVVDPDDPYFKDPYFSRFRFTTKMIEPDVVGNTFVFAETQAWPDGTTGKSVKVLTYTTPQPETSIYGLTYYIHEHCPLGVNEIQIPYTHPIEQDIIKDALGPISEAIHVKCLSPIGNVLTSKLDLYRVQDSTPDGGYLVASATAKTAIPPTSHPIDENSYMSEIALSTYAADTFSTNNHTIDAVFVVDGYKLASSNPYYDDHEFFRLTVETDPVQSHIDDTTVLLKLGDIGQKLGNASSVDLDFSMDGLNALGLLAQYHVENHNNLRYLDTHNGIVTITATLKRILKLGSLEQVKEVLDTKTAVYEPDPELVMLAKSPSGITVHKVGDDIIAEGFVTIYIETDKLDFDSEGYIVHVDLVGASYKKSICSLNYYSGTGVGQLPVVTINKSRTSLILDKNQINWKYNSITYAFKLFIDPGKEGSFQLGDNVDIYVNLYSIGEFDQNPSGYYTKGIICREQKIYASHMFTDYDYPTDLKIPEKVSVLGSMVGQIGSDTTEPVSPNVTLVPFYECDPEASVAVTVQYDNTVFEDGKMYKVRFSVPNTLPGVVIVDSFGNTVNAQVDEVNLGTFNSATPSANYINSWYWNVTLPEEADVTIPPFFHGSFEFTIAVFRVDTGGDTLIQYMEVPYKIKLTNPNP